MKSYIIISDAHCPGHNKPFMEAILGYIYKNRDNLTGLKMGGDILDTQSISHHYEGRLVETTLGEEYEYGNVLLDLFDEAIGGKFTENEYLYGNHEDRIMRYLQVFDNSKLGSALITLTDGLNLIKRGYRVHENWRNGRIQMGDVTLIHGEYLNIHTAMKHAEVFQKNIMFGHTHRRQIANKGMYTGYNIGYLGDVNHPLFNYSNAGAKLQWVNSFSKVDVEDGKSTVTIVDWKGTHFILDGKVYR